MMSGSRNILYNFYFYIVLIFEPIQKNKHINKYIYSIHSLIAYFLGSLYQFQAYTSV